MPTLSPARIMEVGMGFWPARSVRLYRFWGDLSEALRTGSPQNEIKHVELGDAFDFSGADFKEWCRRVGFKTFDVTPLGGPASAAVAYK